MSEREKLAEEYASKSWSDEEGWTPSYDSFIAGWDARDNLAKEEMNKAAAIVEKKDREISALKQQLAWCIEGFEGTIPDFWESTLGERLKLASARGREVKQGQTICEHGSDSLNCLICKL